MDILRQLESHPLFATFTPEALADAVRAANAVTYQLGDLCIRSGQAGEIFGVLISGRLEAVRGFGTPDRQHIGWIEAGECFGEMSLLTGRASSVDVVAVAESQAVVFLQEAIAPTLATNPDAVRFLTRLVTARLAPAIPGPAAPKPEEVRLALGAFEPMRVLALSCRDDSVRYAYFDTTSEKPRAAGHIKTIGAARPVHTFHTPRTAGERTLSAGSHAAAIDDVLAVLTDPKTGVIADPADLSAVGHRVLHGGACMDSPAIIDDEVKKEIARLAPLAPIDNPCNLAGIDTCQKLIPSVPQVAVFDTSFHLTMHPAAYRFALPAELSTDIELRRFGMHGISAEGAARAACDYLRANLDALELVVCHLGAGASITAIDHGRPIDSTMGMTSLGGLVMSTRSGDVDPGLLLHLVNDKGLDPRDLARQLYHESGLLGLSALSGDVVTLLEAAQHGNPRALLAIEVFCRTVRKALCAAIGLLAGADAVLFTGGVGENAADIRARICQGLEWMGLRLDEMRNRSAGVQAGQVVEISEIQSATRVLVVGGNEEHTVATKTVRALAHRRVTNVIRRSNRPIPISPSAHHVHLTQEHVEALFGPACQLTRYADLSQPGQFACNEQVALIGRKDRIERVRVLGPARPETQVEISRTEEFKLGLDAPIRISGDLAGSPGIAIEGPKGKITIDHGVICAMRHVHMSPEDAMAFALRDGDVVRVRVPGERSLIFGDVAIRVSPHYRLDMHIDTDEANADELSPGALGFLDSIQSRASS